MKIEKVISDYLDANVFLIGDEKQCIIVDAGVNLESIKPVVANRKVLAILLTHGHFDHSRYCNDYANFFSCKIYASSEIINTMQDKEAIYSDKGQIINDFQNFIFLENDEDFKLDNYYVQSYYCPGHSICCRCYLINGILFAGDVLFDRSVGRTDLKFSNKKDMVSTLEKLDKLAFDKVFSGHGNSSTFAEQKKNILVYKKFLSR